MQSTRQEILVILKGEKQATVEDLASRLKLTPMTIRHHLNVLQAQNLVTANQVRRSQKVGRPRLIYTLTEAADNLFPQSYGDLARHLVSEIKGSMSPQEVQGLFARIGERIAAEAPPPIPGQSFEERLDQITDFLDGHGFLFRWEKTEEGYVLINLNCPYRQVTKDHAEVCGMDTVLVARLLGMEVQRTGRLREGDSSCSCLLIPPQ